MFPPNRQEWEEDMAAKHRGRNFWRSLVKEYEASEQSREAFAKSRRIKPSTFQYWLYKIRRERSTKLASPFVEIDIQPTQANGQVRLEFPSGAILVFDRAPSFDELSAIIKTLCDSRC